jgi:diguanylate cyclase (GGDEF)-like protein
MSAYRHLRLRCAFATVVLAATACCPLPARSQPPATPEPPAASFDSLFERLEVGDLTALGVREQQQIAARLQALLPAGDAHRQRLLDSARCGLDFVDANKDGFDFADTHLAQALAAHDDGAAIRFYYCRGAYQEALKSARDALADYERGIALARSSGDDIQLALGLEARGGVYSLLGIYGKALADLLEARRIFNQNEFAEAAGQTLLDIGITYRRLGSSDKAREFLNQAVEHARRVGDTDTQFVSTLQLGYSDQETGHYDTALATQQRALALARSSGDRSDIAAANLAVASVLVDLHRYQDALTGLDAAQTGFDTSGDHASTGMIAFERGNALTGLGHHRKALAEFAVAERIFKESGNQRYQEMLYRAQAKVLEADGNAPGALAAIRNFLAAHDAVIRERANQQAQMLQEQFDTDRAKIENDKLRAEQAMKDRQVRDLQSARHWQQLAMALLAILLTLLAAFAIRQLARLRNWKRMASVDPLTDVANLRGVQQFTAKALRKARGAHDPLSVLAIDVDEFKRVNDTHGHAVGDRVLRRIARACAEALREGDLLGRVGGEEFLAILPNTSLDRALDVAERLRHRVEGLDLADLPPGLNPTISIGVAQMQTSQESAAELTQRADMALYQAKAQGRNRVVGTDA